MIKFYCSCGKKIGVPEQYAGRRVLCPQCGTAHITPAADPPPDGEDASAAADAQAYSQAPTGPAEQQYAPQQYAPQEYTQQEYASQEDPQQEYAPQAAEPQYAQAEYPQGYAEEYPQSGAYPQPSPTYPQQAQYAAPAAPAYAPHTYAAPHAYAAGPAGQGAYARPPARRKAGGGFPVWAWALVAAVPVVGLAGWAAMKFSGRPATAPSTPVVASAGKDAPAGDSKVADDTSSTPVVEDLKYLDGQKVGGPGGLKERPGWLSATAEKPSVSPAATPADKPTDKPAVATTAPPGPDLSPAEVFKRSSPAVVKVIVADGSGKPFSQGSGFFVEADGVLVTNYHVIRGGSKASIEVPGAGAYDVTGVLAHDKDMDLAVLKVAITGQTALKLATDVPPVGSRVFAIGSPLGLTNTLSEGLVSGIRGGGTDGPPAIQTSAPISHGSSGGPLLSADGRVVGVTSAGIEAGQNLNLAIPAAEVDRLLSNRKPPVPLADVSGPRRLPRVVVPSTGPARPPGAGGAKR